MYNVYELLPCSLCSLELRLNITAVHSCDNLLNGPLSEGLPIVRMSQDLVYIGGGVNILNLNVFGLPDSSGFFPEEVKSPRLQEMQTHFFF